jgi:hypothetical protein
MPELLQIVDRGWQWSPYQTSFEFGKVDFTHDVGKCGRYAALQSVESYGYNVVIGHTHRGGVAYSGTVRGDTHVCLDTGWLGDANKVGYRHINLARKEWQHGFGYIQMEDSGVFTAAFIPIVERRAIIDGKVIR